MDQKGILSPKNKHVQLQLAYITETHAAAERRQILLSRRADRFETGAPILANFKF